MSTNSWRFRARARAKWTADNPKFMNARYAGTCDHCKGSFPQGAPIAYSRGTCWHAACHPLRNEAQPGRAAAPEPVPEPADTGVYEVRYTGAATLTAHTDAVIRDRHGNTLFASFLGSDSIVKAFGAGFVEGKARDRIYFDGPQRHRHGAQSLRRNRELTYKRRVTKLTRGAQELCYADQFEPMHLEQLEKNYKLLLVAPDEEPAAVTYQYLARMVPTPTLPAWAPAIWEQLTENWQLYGSTQAEDAFACAHHIEPDAGNYSAISLRVTEEAFDHLISQLVREGRIEF